MTSQLILERGISGLTADDSVLVLADIVGGSPFNHCSHGSRRSWKARWSLDSWWDEPHHGLDGSCVMKDVLDGDDLSATILSEARSALQPFEVSATGAEEDDDDI